MGYSPGGHRESDTTEAAVHTRMYRCLIQTEQESAPHISATTEEMVKNLTGHETWL